MRKISCLTPFILVGGVIIPPFVLLGYLIFKRALLEEVLGNLVLIAWGTHLVTAFILHTTMVTGPVFVSATDEMHYVRIGLMLLGAIFYCYFGYQIVSQVA